MPEDDDENTSGVLAAVGAAGLVDMDDPDLSKYLKNAEDAVRLLIKQMEAESSQDDERDLEQARRMQKQALNYMSDAADPQEIMTLKQVRVNCKLHTLPSNNTRSHRP